MLENLPIPPDEESQTIDLQEKNLVSIETNSVQEENPKKKNFTGLIILGIICILGLFFGFFQSEIFDSDNLFFPSSKHTFGKGKFIATISIEGTIEEKNQTYDQLWLLSTIEELKYNSNNVGIMLKINSPGGAVYESDEVYLALLDYKTSGKPIFANEVTTSFEGDVTYTYYTDSLCTKKTTNDVGVAIEGSAPVDAGMYYVKAKLDATGNSNEAITKCVPHIIEPKVIDVKWEQTEFTYNGEYKVPTVSAISGVNDEAFIFTTSKEFEPGIYPTSAECFSVNGGRGKCSNYWFKNNTNTFKINKAQPTVSLSSKAVLYNGSPISAYDAITNSGGNISYRYYIDNMCTSEVSFENGGIPIDAGNYYVKAFVSESEYYTNGYSGCVSHKIIPVSVDVNINNNSFVYDGSIKNITYSTSYVKVNDELDENLECIYYSNDNKKRIQIIKKESYYTLKFEKFNIFEESNIYTTQNYGYWIIIDDGASHSYDSVESLEKDISDLLTYYHKT